MLTNGGLNTDKQPKMDCVTGRLFACHDKQDGNLRTTNAPTTL